ncbi:ABC transporter ATP-binding protein [Rhodococcus sp. WS4]|nr:ABC transporter ATP-binding protein [Rhodococcus sp. WS4]
MVVNEVVEGHTEWQAGNTPPTENYDVVQLVGVSFTPESALNPTLIDIDFTVSAGEMVIVCGPSGSGKSTLISCINGLIPHFASGKLEGRISIGGVDTQEAPMAAICANVATVQQDPSAGMFSLTVENEVAFGPENLGRTKEELLVAVPSALEAAGIPHLANSATATLSGGQLQRTAIAGAIAMGSQLVLFDEPTTDLDPTAKRDVSAQIAKLKAEGNKSIIVVEHDLDHLVEYADRIVVLNEGRIVLDCSPATLCSDHLDQLEDLGVRIPDHVRLGRILRQQGYEIQCSDGTLNRAGEQLRSAQPTFSAPFTVPPRERHSDTATLQFDDVAIAYGRGKPLFSNVSFTLNPGEITVILGENGTGKSTIGKAACRLIDARSGTITIQGRPIGSISRSELSSLVGYCFQNPDLQLFCNSVREELEFGLPQGTGVTEQAAQQALDAVGLSDAALRHPHELSRGQRKRLAVATALVRRPRLLILDEPTTGQDAANIHEMLRLVKYLATEHGTAVLMVTHDIELAFSVADRFMVMDSGRMLANCSAEQLKSNAHNYPGVHYSPVSKLIQSAFPNEDVSHLADFERRLQAPPNTISARH